MSIASRITEINSHLLDDYSVLTLAGADLTNVDKNIVNLSPTWKERLLYFINNGTDEVWNNWDKVTGEGTSLTLTPTEEAPMKIVYKGNTYQNGEPTPDTPIPVQVVSGDNSIEVCGKNLFDDSAFSTNPNVSVDSNGFYTGTLLNIYTYFNNNFKNYAYKENTQYTITYTSYGSNTSSNGRFVVSYTDGTTQNWNITSNASATNIIYRSTSGKTISKITMSFSSSGTMYIKNIMMVEGNYDSQTMPPYEPYTGASYPINLPEGMELCKIGTYQDKIDKSSGNNLVEATITNANLSAAGVLVTHSDYDMHIAKVVQGKTYTITTTVASDKVLGFFANYPTIGSSTYDNSRVVQSSYTFTAPITGYVAFRSATGYATPMINEGTTALPYEPYGTSWYLKKEIGKVILDGVNYTSSNFSTTHANRCIIANLPNQRIVSYGTQTSYMTHFTYNPSAYRDGEDIVCYCNRNNSNGIFIRFGSQSTITSSTLANQWLQQNEPILYYELETPTYTLIEGELLNQLETIKMSYEGQTNLSQTNNDMPFILNPSALKKV